MATEQNFTIRKGRTSEIDVYVPDVLDWTGLEAKLYAYSSKEESSIVFAIDGTIMESADTVTFAITHDMTKNVNESSLYYEIVVFKSDKSYIKDTNFGLLTISTVGMIDPTI